MEKGDKGSMLTRMGVSGWMFLLVPAYPGCPGQTAVKWLLLLLLYRHETRVKKLDRNKTKYTTVTMNKDNKKQEISQHKQFANKSKLILKLVNYYHNNLQFPSVLWRCWLGDRKGIQPVKKLSGGLQVWLSVWSKVQTCIRPSWCHCHSLSLASVKSRLVFIFLVPAHPGSHGQRAAKRVCVYHKSSCLCNTSHCCKY